MDPENVEVTAELTPAPDAGATAAPDTDVSTPETQTDVDSNPQKVFTQEELDAAIGKRLAREQRKWEREQQALLARLQQPSTEIDGELRSDQFESPEAYAEALAERKAQQLVARQRAQEQERAVLAAYHDREEQARDKYEDFETVAYNPRVPITEVMAQAIRHSDIGPDVAYHLGSNIKEAERISRLPPFLQAKEIGKIEAKLASEPAPAKKISSAPAPIVPVTPRSNGNPTYDTTDPRSVKTMTASEWIAAERERQIRKMQARQA